MVVFFPISFVMYQNKKAICWFENDLRLADNPAWWHAVQQGQVLPIYILDSASPGPYSMGAASKWWLHHSLHKLQHALTGHLMVRSGDPLNILNTVAKEHDIGAIYWNKRYTPWQLKRDKVIQKNLQAQGMSVHTYNAALLWEPSSLLKKDGTPYKVFTPFYKKGCLTAPRPRQPMPYPTTPAYLKLANASSGIDALSLLPTTPWSGKLAQYWSIGEKAAQQRLATFLSTGLLGYKEKRNFPGQTHVSRLSPHLTFGEISIHQVWHTVHGLRNTAYREDVSHFCSELGWREFAYHLLYHFPKLPYQNFNAKFDAFPWQQDQPLLAAWQKGQTGIPIVDAGMRELWQTGYMHNRVRMIVASFLTKNLLLDWRSGAAWFWDCLVDADLANNSASWQWVAGCGADAAPYFRIFNPVLQGRKFDPHGDYIKAFVPELQSLPAPYLFSPWEAPKSMLAGAGVTLGVTYPFPMVDLKASRKKALAAYHALRQSLSSSY